LSEISPHNTSSEDNTRIAKLRLFPEPRVLAEEEKIYEPLEIPSSSAVDSPYVLANMVSSVDGRISAHGKSFGMGSAVDRSCMRALRSQVDAVMVGAGSLRAEKMDLGLDRGDGFQPLAVIVGGSGGLPLEENLINRNQKLAIALPEGAAVPEEASRVSATIIETPGDGSRVDLRHLLAALRSMHGIQTLLVEGGPSLSRALLKEGLLNELFLTLAPKLVLGRQHSLLDDAPEIQPKNLSLVSVHAAADELFLRYRLRDH
jgi:riboflavin-specific deaminase-like protein